MSSKNNIIKCIEGSIGVKKALLDDEFIIDNINSAVIHLFECIRNGNKVYICGNGGSAADAQHFAAELVGHFGITRNALPAVCLSNDAVLITAIANDYGFHNVFSRQLQGIIKSDDVLFVISTSGNSKNVLNAVKVAMGSGCKIVALTGKNGGELQKYPIHIINVPSENTARIQETHIMIIHIICELLEDRMKCSNE